MVSMAHPHLLCGAALKQTIKQRVVRDFLNKGAAKLARGAAFDPPAELLHHSLLTIANPQHGHAERKNCTIHPRAILSGYTGRTAGQDNGLWIIILQKRSIDFVEGVNFAIHAAFAQATCDELRYLRAEVYDEGAFVLFTCHGAV